VPALPGVKIAVLEGPLNQDEGVDVLATAA
jgi:hypothetical protein